MRRLLEAMRIVRLVWLEHSVGNFSLRIVHNSLRGPTRERQLWAAAIISSNPSILNDDGTTSGASYITKWHPYNDRSPQLKSPVVPLSKGRIVESEWPEYINGSWR